MKIDRCLSCLKKTTQVPCPHCGFDPANYVKPKNSLNYGDIIDGRYMIGCVRSQNDMIINYNAIDLSANKAVEIAEYFPAMMAFRADNGAVGLVSLSDQGDFDAAMSVFESAAINEANYASVEEAYNKSLMFRDNSTVYCIMKEVGDEEKQKKAKPAKAPKQPKPANPVNKKIIGIIAAAAVVIVAVVVGGIFISKSGTYKKAEAAFESGNYSEAYDKFMSLGSYSDAADRAVEVCIAAADELKEAGKFEDAIAELAPVKSEKAAGAKLGECWMGLGHEKIRLKNYAAAIDAFENAVKYDAEDAEDYKIYAEGMKAMTDGDYSGAVEKLTKSVKTTKDTDSVCAAYEALIASQIAKEEFDNADTSAVKYRDFCSSNKLSTENAEYHINGIPVARAEALYDSGYLNEALAAFEAAPEGAVYEDIDRDARIKKLNDHSKLLKMEGEWLASSGRTSISQGYVMYYIDITKDMGLEASIRFILNDDGTISATGYIDWVSLMLLERGTREKILFTTNVELSNVKLRDLPQVEGGIDLSVGSDGLHIDFRAKDGTHVYHGYQKQ